MDMDKKGFFYEQLQTEILYKSRKIFRLSVCLSARNNLFFFFDFFIF